MIPQSDEVLPPRADDTDAVFNVPVPDSLVPSTQSRAAVVMDPATAKVTVDVIGVSVGINGRGVDQRLVLDLGLADAVPPATFGAGPSTVVSVAETIVVPVPKSRTSDRSYSSSIVD